MTFNDALATLEILHLDLNTWLLPNFKLKAKSQYRKLSHKYHPDKGGSVEAFVKLKDALDLIENLIELPKTRHTRPKPAPPPPSRSDFDLFLDFRDYLRQNIGSQFILEEMFKAVRANRAERAMLEGWALDASELGYITGKVMYVPHGITLLRFELACKLRGVNGQSFGLFPEQSLRTYEKFFQRQWGGKGKIYNK